jgi:hypothetical protein
LALIAFLVLNMRSMSVTRKAYFNTIPRIPKTGIRIIALMRLESGMRNERGDLQPEQLP